MFPTTKRRKNELTIVVFVPYVMVLYMLMWRSIVPVISQIS